MVTSGSGARAEVEASARLGTTVGGKFLLKSVIGIGGNGFVYEGYDVESRRIVALKMPRPHRASRTRFRREAIAGGSITHPNVCTLHAFGQDATGAPFLVMERLTGETLAGRIHREPQLPLALAVDVLRQSLWGLGAAHARKIVHRDMKPGNIFLSGDTMSPIVKILDFGCSTSGGRARPDDAEPLTRVGSVIGTPQYMSPEQVSGRRDFDPRVDVFACGVVLYEIVTGRRPFRGTDAKSLFKNIAGGVFVRASARRPELPTALDEILGVALAVDRRRRFPSARAFADALAGLSVPAGLVTAAPPAPIEGEPRAERLRYLQKRFREVAVLHEAAKPRTRDVRRVSRMLDLPTLVELDPPSDSFQSQDTSTEKIVPEKGGSCGADP
jgi:eukaryotic-like serine/threonine-protein kinase